MCGALRNQIDLHTCLTVKSGPLGIICLFPGGTIMDTTGARSPRGQKHCLGGPLFTGNIQGRLLNPDIAGFIGGTSTSRTSSKSPFHPFPVPIITVQSVEGIQTRKYRVTTAGCCLELHQREHLKLHKTLLASHWLEVKYLSRLFLVRMPLTKLTRRHSLALQNSFTKKSRHFTGAAAGNKYTTVE